MSVSFIPTQDALALAWMQSFAAGLAASPGTYAVSAGDVSTIENAVQAFADAWAVCQQPATRGPISIAAKNVARAAAEQLCRQFAAQIKVNAGISDVDKLAIGVRPVNPHRSQPIVPSTSPALLIVAATPGAQTLRYSDSLTPDSRAKPPGAMQLQVFVAIKDAATALESEAKFVGSFTRNPLTIGFDEADDGKMATYFARWSNRSGEVGPWSNPVSMRIAA